MGRNSTLGLRDGDSKRTVGPKGCGMMVCPLCPLEDASPGCDSWLLRTEKFVDVVPGSQPITSANLSLARGTLSEVVGGAKSADVTLCECPRPVDRVAEENVDPFVADKLAISEKERVLRSLRGPEPPAVCGLPDTDPVLVNTPTLMRERRGD